MTTENITNEGPATFLELTEEEKAQAIASYLLFTPNARGSSSVTGSTTISPWDTLPNFRNA